MVGIQGAVTILIGMFTLRLQFKGWLIFNGRFIFKEIWYMGLVHIKSD